MSQQNRYSYQQNSELELCYKTSVFLVENVEGLQDLMLDTLHHPHTGLFLLLAVAQVEGHGADLAEEFTASFHFEHVGQPSLLTVVFASFS